MVQTTYYISSKPVNVCRCSSREDQYSEMYHPHTHYKNLHRGTVMKALGAETDRDNEGESQRTNTSSEKRQDKSESTDRQKQTHSTWPSMAGQKRSANSEESSDDDDDDDEKRPRKSNQQIEKSPRYACPFYKRSPDEFVDERSCRGPGWATIQRVKEHIFRKHKGPDYHCPRCFVEFKNEQSMMQHFRAQETCKVRQAPSGSSQVDGSKMRLLKQRGKATGTEDEKWYAMYRIIFPNDVSLPNPYYEPEEKGNALPSKAVAQKMFRENLDERLSTWDLGGTPGNRGLQHQELINLIISGATAAFDKTFTAMCSQNAEQTLDSQPAVMAKPTQDDGQWHQRLVTDLETTLQTSSQVGEVPEFALDEVSNSRFQHGSELDLYTDTCSLQNDDSIGLLSWDQPQQQKQGQVHPQPGHSELRTEIYDCSLCGVSFKTQDLFLLHVCIPAPPGQGFSAESVSTSLQQVHTGFNFAPPTRNDMLEVGDGGNALDRDLVTDNHNGDIGQKGGSADAAAQSLGTAKASSNDEHSQDLSLWHDNFAHLWFQNDPNYGGSNWY